MIREACVETLSEAILAESRGVDRIELCSRLDLDGLTPSSGLIREVCSRLKIPVMVMIRPREGNFVYSEEEIGVMWDEIDQAKTLGAAGVVFGVLTPENQVAIDTCRRLAERAFPLPVTFHKAIDLTSDPAEGVCQLMACGGITRILTSGGKPTAREGAPKIRQMRKIAGDRLIMLVAGKVTCDNLEEIRALTGATEFHGRRIAGDLVKSSN